VNELNEKKNGPVGANNPADAPKTETIVDKESEIQRPVPKEPVKPMEKPTQETKPVEKNIEAKAPVEKPAEADATQAKEIMPATPPKHSTPAKKETKPKEENKMAKTKKKGKKAVWVKKEKQKKEKSILGIAEQVKEKNKPNFWGRFGKKNIRKQRMEKYNKWRKPTGIDILAKKSYGKIVQTGFRTPKSIRGRHPSGYEEVRAFSRKDLELVQKDQAVRIASNVGRKKKIELIKTANEKKITILN
jgi:large subunit ribosomal protein L32e